MVKKRTKSNCSRRHKSHTKRCATRHHKKHYSRKHMRKHSRKHLKKYNKRRHRYSRRQRGGKKYTPGGWNWSFIPTWKTRNTLTPTPLLNLGRSMITGGENLMNGWNGVPSAVSPLPTAQPDLLIEKQPVIPPNLTAINKNAQNYVMSKYA